jgi:hypothetical protein
MGLVSQNYDGETPNAGIQARCALWIHAHPRRMHDNDGENAQAWHECGLDDGLWEIHVCEIESQCVILQRPPRECLCLIVAMGAQHMKHGNKYSTY